MLKLPLQYGQAYARHAEATHGQAYVTVWSSLRASCSCLPLVMLMLTLQYGQAYATATEAFVLRSPFVPPVAPQ